MSHTRLKGWSCREGVLVAWDRPRHLEWRIGGWPKLEAHFRERRREWMAFAPESKLIRPCRREPKPTKPEPEVQLALPMALPATATPAPPKPPQRRHSDLTGALEEYRSATFPPEVARRVEAFTGHQWEVLRLLRDHDEAADLLDSSPGLGFLVANRRAKPLVGTSAARYPARHLLKLKHRDLLEHFGLSRRKAHARIVARIPAASARLDLVTLLRQVLADDEQAAWLTYLSVVPQGVLALLANDGTRPMANPKLVAAVAESEREAHAPYVVDRLRDLIQMGHELGVDVERLTIETLERLEALHDELSEQYLAQMDVARCGPLPPPPLPGMPGFIEPLLTAKALAEEGRVQHNCVGSYGWRVADGECFVYRVKGATRATLAVSRSTGRWGVEELRGACNGPVDVETARMVGEWLEQEQGL